MDAVFNGSDDSSPDDGIPSKAAWYFQRLPLDSHAAAQPALIQLHLFISPRTCAFDPTNKSMKACSRAVAAMRRGCVRLLTNMPQFSSEITVLR